METLVIGIVVVALFGQIVNLVIVGRFIDLIEDMHKREFRKTSNGNISEKDLSAFIKNWLWLIRNGEYRKE